MNRDGRSSSNDPTADPVTDQSTQSAAGLSGGRASPAVQRSRRADELVDLDLHPDPGHPDSGGLDEEVVNRTAADATPRRYDQPIEQDDDPLSEQEGDASRRERD